MNLQEMIERIEDVHTDDHPVYGTYGTQHLGYRDVEGDKTVFLLPMTYGKVRLAIGPTNEGFLDDGYCYESPRLLQAVLAFATWDGNGDPIDGWHRHLKTGRRRPEGEAIREYVNH